MPSAGPHAPGALQSTFAGGHSTCHSQAGPFGFAFGLGSHASFPTDPSGQIGAYIGEGPQSHAGGGGGGGHGLMCQPHFPGAGVGGPGSGVGAGGGFAGSVDPPP